MISFGGLKVVSVRLSDADDARIKGAGAVTGLSVSAYLKWLVTNGKTGTQSHTEMLLRRFDDLAAAIANFGAARGEDRGVPSSAIRQVEAALDETEQEAARGGTRVNTNV